MKHTVIHTGGNIYNDYVSDFDNTGRVIIVSEGGIRLYANDRDYQCGCNPISWSSCDELPDESKCADCGASGWWEDIGTTCLDCGRGIMVSGAGYEPIKDNSQVSEILTNTESVLVRDIEGATLIVYRAY